MITFDPLWKTMQRKNVTIYALIKKHNISPGQITRLKHNQNVTTNTLDALCMILDCQVQDICQFKK